jgi:uncharacterized membrane protein YozB (DUF420 family)
LSNGQAIAIEQPLTKRRARPRHARFFYTGAAGLLFVLMFLGFQQFYLRGRAFPDRELTPPIRTVLILHGVAMTAWMLLFLVQPLLIATEKRRMHMTMGKIGAGLAAAVVILGVMVGVGAARVNPPEMVLWGLPPKQFPIVPLSAVVIFGLLVAMGVWKRKQPDAHRPLMLLSILAVMPAAMDRIALFHSMYEGTVWGTIFGPYFSTHVVGLMLVVVHWALTRSLNRWLAVGYAGLVASSAFVMWFATTGAWDWFAGLLVG